MKLNIVWNENLVTQRTHARLLRENVRKAIEYHREIVLPKHFTIAGAKKYGFTPRTRKTQLVKSKKYGHQLPNVMTGKMRNIVITQSKVTSTQYGGRLYARNYFPMDARRRYEIEQVAVDEQADMAKRIEKWYAVDSNSKTNQRKRRVKTNRK